jgi:hypothetical protein
VKLITQYSSNYGSRVNPFAGYWVKDNSVYAFDHTHIIFVIDNTELFGITDPEIKDCYKKHSEQLGTEGRAREEIIKRVSKDGWIRVRHYKKPDYWTVQFDEYQIRISIIEDFIQFALENLGMTPYDPIVLTGYFDGYKKEFSFKDGGVGQFITELQR